MRRRSAARRSIASPAFRQQASTPGPRGRRWSRTCATRRRGSRTPGSDSCSEPVNSRDIPGFFIDRTQPALDVIADVGAENLKLQYDIYHAQVMEGDLARTIEREFASHRPHPARRQSRPQRAGNRGDQLSLAVSAHRRARLRRLDRLRIQAAHDDDGWPLLAQVRSRPSQTRLLPSTDPEPGAKCMTNIGFIGLGIMGRPMAGHLDRRRPQAYSSTSAARRRES